MKQIIRGIALSAAVFVFGTVANAQINYGADVDIPFEFSVGDQAYESGRYTVKISKQLVAGTLLTIRKNGTDEAQSVLMSNSGGERSDDVQLVFRSFDGRKYLTSITTANNEFAVLSKAGRNGKLAKVKINAATRTNGL